MRAANRPPLAVLALSSLTLLFASTARADDPAVTAVDTPSPARDGEVRASDGPAAIPSVAAADSDAPRQSGAALAEPPAGVAPRRAEPLPAPVDEDPPWDGPRVELGYTHYSLGDGFGGGAVHAVSFGGYLPTGQLRLGLIGDGGARDYALGGGDAVLRATLVAGWQGVGLVDYVMPYVVAVASCGVVVGQRFATTFADALLGLGVEVGFEVNPVRTLHFGASLAHVRADLDGLGYGLWVLRLFVGL